jgi:hypothetical protein
MPSPALDAYVAWVNGTTLSASRKAEAIDNGTLLYRAAIREEAAHLGVHLDAALAGATGDDALLLARLKTVVDAISTDAAPDAHQVPDYLTTTTDAERAWGQALGGLLTSLTVARASAYFDFLLARYDAPGVRARLLALRDLITAKLGP